MIYSSDRIHGSSKKLDPKYLGAGVATMQIENAQDLLENFNLCIASDFEEAAALNEGSEIINEGVADFFKNVYEKIKELMKKLIHWLDGIMHTVTAKLAQIIVRDNATYVKVLRKRINKTDFSKFKLANTEYIIKAEFEKANASTDLKDDYMKYIKFDDNMTVETAKKELDAKEEHIKDIKASDTIKDMTNKTDSSCKGSDAVKYVTSSMEILELLDRKSIKELKKGFKDAIKDANDVIKEAKDNERDAIKAVSADDNQKNQDAKEIASINLRAANLMKQEITKTRSAALEIIKKAAKVSRAIVYKAAAYSSPKNEGALEDVDYETIQECSEYEFDSALEESVFTEEDVVDDDEDFDDDED